MIACGTDRGSWQAAGVHCREGNAEEEADVLAVASQVLALEGALPLYHILEEAARGRGEQDAEAVVVAAACIVLAATRPGVGLKRIAGWDSVDCRPSVSCEGTNRRHTAQAGGAAEAAASLTCSTYPT